MPTRSTARHLRKSGLKFPGDDQPDYWDFIYFAFVIGMTFQVSDVAITHKSIRRMVVAHGALSFFFTAAIVAMTVNIAASIIQKSAAMTGAPSRSLLFLLACWCWSRSSPSGSRPRRRSCW